MIENSKKGNPSHGDLEEAVEIAHKNATDGLQKAVAELRKELEGKVGHMCSLF